MYLVLFWGYCSIPVSSLFCLKVYSDLWVQAAAKILKHNTLPVYRANNNIHNFHKPIFICKGITSFHLGNYLWKLQFPYDTCKIHRLFSIFTLGYQQINLCMFPWGSTNIKGFFLLVLLSSYPSKAHPFFPPVHLLEILGTVQLCYKWETILTKRGLTFASLTNSVKKNFLHHSILPWVGSNWLNCNLVMCERQNSSASMVSAGNNSVVVELDFGSKAQAWHETLVLLLAVKFINVHHSFSRCPCLHSIRAAFVGTFANGTRTRPIQRAKTYGPGNSPIINPSLSSINWI